MAERLGGTVPLHPLGINVDDLAYGNLGTAGNSLSPFHERTEGYGTHEIECRSLDAASNVSGTDRFRVTVREPSAGTNPALEASAFPHCGPGEITIDMTVANTSAEAVEVSVYGDHGTLSLGRTDQ